jgi:hypothetical protein
LQTQWRWGGWRGDCVPIPEHSRSRGSEAAGRHTLREFFMGRPKIKPARVSPGVNGVEASFASRADSLRQLQTLAGTFSLRLPPSQSVITLQVLLVVGTANPWRLVENRRSSVRHPRRMLCFASLERIWRAIEEYLRWQHADALFVTSHMVTPGGFPGVTADWVHSNDFELVFTPQRETMRAEICVTRPEEIVMLP